MTDNHNNNIIRNDKKGNLSKIEQIKKKMINKNNIKKNIDKRHKKKMLKI